MTERNKAALTAGAGFALWFVNAVLTDSEMLGALGNTIGTVLFIWGTIRLVGTYRKN